MSTYRHGWWPYAKYMIRVYPNHVRDLSELHRQSVTASYSGMPHGGVAGRTIESLSIRELPTNAQREYMAVFQTIEATKRKKDGNERLSFIDMVYWKQTHTITGAAAALHISERTAKEWNRVFIHTVAEYYGLED